MSDLNDLVSLCVSHLRDHAKHYLRLVQSKSSEGILWAVFRVVERESPLDRPVQLAKASFLPLASMASSKADVLIKMQRDCDATHQFVCWFTLDDGRGNALASKVLVIDVGEVAAPASSEEDDEEGRDASSVFVPPAASALSNVSVATTARKDTRSGAAAGSGSAPGAPSAGVPLSAQPRPRSPKSVKELLAAVAAVSTRPSASEANEFPNPAAKKDNAEPSLNMLMKMVMQVSDSVASMGAAMDKLSLRFSTVEEQVSKISRRVHELEKPIFGPTYDFEAEQVAATAGASSGVARSSAEGKQRSIVSNSEMLMQLTEAALRIGEAENRIRSLENHSASSDALRQSMFDQLQSIRAKLADLQHAHRPDAARHRRGGADAAEASHLTEYPWRSEAAATPAARQLATTSTVMSAAVPATARVLADTPLSFERRDCERVSTTQHVADGSQRSLSSPPRGAWNAVVSSSPPRRAGDATANPSATSPRVGTLSDMIRTLEVRLGGHRK